MWQGKRSAEAVTLPGMIGTEALMSRREKSSMPLGVLIVLVSLAAILCIVLGTLMYLDNRALIRNEEADDKVTQSQAKAEAEDKHAMEAAHDDLAGAPVIVNDPAGEDGAYEDLLPENKTVDIPALKISVNPDIYAWLYIPDTGIDEAVLQHPEDITYYSTHNSEGTEDEDGALYTQNFNSMDFSDNMTVIYGHNGDNDKAFSNLNVYADPEFFKSHPYIYVYTEDAVLLYRTFAAYESDDKLIVVFYGTQDDDMYNAYLQKLDENIGINSNIDREGWPGPSDKILTLSTGIAGKDDRRFLVQAKFLGGFVEDKDNE